MNKTNGLSRQQVKQRQEQYGPNEIAKKSAYSAGKLILDQLKSPLIYILLVASVITFFLKEFKDTVIILAAVVMNTMLGFFQESKAQKTLESLNKLLAPKTKVIRDKERQMILASQLVPGDLVVLELGARVPADGMVVEQDSLAVNEAILTGESEPVDKEATTEKNPTKLKDKNQVFMGTIVAGGIGKMMVTTIGSKTKMGQIATTLEETEEPKTPLQKRLDEISKFLAIFVGITGLLVFVIGLILGHSFLEMFTTSVALAVASIPEGLAVSLTVILAVGMQRILRRQAIVRQLVSAETLGSVTTICVDKTGTLTEGKMRVVGGEFTDRRLGVASAILCNDQRDPLEIGMTEWAQKQPEYHKNLFQKHPRLDTIPFDPDHKYIATLLKNEDKKLLLVSGAPEILLEMSVLSGQQKKHWLKIFDDAAGKGFRIVAFAFKKIKKEKITREDINELNFLGVLYFADPPRESVKLALEECRQAGIKVKVITGDYKKTAMVVMAKLGLLSKQDNNKVIGGDELEKMTKPEKFKAVKNALLFSRVSPWQKLEIVEILQAQGEVIAMTGDGVNDAPALKKADIGIVVEDASDVAKQTADIVLLDSNFNTIVHAIEEGRGMFDNIRKIILYLLCDAFGEVILVIGSLVLQVPLAITASQILWINLVSDGFPSLALTVEPKEDDLMKRPPRPLSEPVVNTEVRLLIGLISGMAGLLTLGLYLYYLFGLQVPIEYARTVAFASMGINTLLYVFSCRNLQKPLWRENQFKNIWLLIAVAGGALLQLSALYLPSLQRFLNTVSLNGRDWEMILSINIAVMAMIETVKWIFVKKARKANKI